MASMRQKRYATVRLMSMKCLRLPSLADVIAIGRGDRYGVELRSLAELRAAIYDVEIGSHCGSAEPRLTDG
ncbi:MAG: hypothetical protein QOK48_580 [Blastocatellia bacterium]|nr:hypothetical protein [Blastocatellia bacterium]